MELKYLLICVIILAITMVTEGQFPEYGIVVDAGSSGSRARVYRITLEGSQVQVPRMREIHSYKVRPGISYFKDNVTGVNDYIQELMKDVREKGQIPEIRRKDTPFYFMATAGGFINFHIYKICKATKKLWIYLYNVCCYFMYNL